MEKVKQLSTQKKSKNVADEEQQMQSILIQQSTNRVSETKKSLHKDLYDQYFVQQLNAYQETDFAYIIDKLRQGGIQIVHNTQEQIKKGARQMKKKFKTVNQKKQDNRYQSQNKAIKQKILLGSNNSDCLFQILDKCQTFSPQVYQIVVLLNCVYKIKLKVIFNTKTSQTHKYQTFSKGSYGDIYLHFQNNIFQQKWSALSETDESICSAQVLEIENQNLIQEQFQKSHEHVSQGFIVKCFKVKDQESFCTRFQNVLKEYCIGLIASALEWGPKLTKNMGFDIMVYKDCIEFAMELCSTEKKITSEAQKDLRSSLYLMHRHLKLVHLDVKTGNIAYSPTFEKWVFIDFGFSEFIKEDIGEMTQTCFVGTYEYASDEMKKTLAKDNHVDLYYNDLHGLKKSFVLFRNALNKKFVIEAQIQLDSAHRPQNSLAKSAVEKNIIQNNIRQPEFKKKSVKQNGYDKYQIYQSRQYLDTQDIENERKPYWLQVALSKLKYSLICQSYSRAKFCLYFIMKNYSNQEQLLIFDKKSKWSQNSDGEKQKQQSQSEYLQSIMKKFKIQYQPMPDLFKQQFLGVQFIKFYNKLMFNEFFKKKSYQKTFDSKTKVQIRKQIDKQTVNHFNKCNTENNDSKQLAQMKNKIFKGQLFTKGDIKYRLNNQIIKKKIKKNNNKQSFRFKQSFGFENIFSEKNLKQNLKGKLLNEDFIGQLQKFDYYKLVVAFATFRKNYYNALLSDKAQVCEMFIKQERVCEQSYFNEKQNKQTYENIIDCERQNYQQQQLNKILQVLRHLIEQSSKEPFNHQKRELFPIVCSELALLDYEMFEADRCNLERHSSASFQDSGIQTGGFKAEQHLKKLKRNHNFFHEWYFTIVRQHGFRATQKFHSQKVLESQGCLGEKDNLPPSKHYFYCEQQEQETLKCKKFFQRAANFLMMIQKLLTINDSFQILFFRNKPLVIDKHYLCNYIHMLSFLLQDERTLTRYFKDEKLGILFGRLLSLNQYSEYRWYKMQKHRRENPFQSDLYFTQQLLNKSQLFSSRISGQSLGKANKLNIRKQIMQKYQRFRKIIHYFTKQGGLKLLRKEISSNYFIPNQSKKRLMKKITLYLYQCQEDTQQYSYQASMFPLIQPSLQPRQNNSIAELEGEIILPASKSLTLKRDKNEYKNAKSFLTSSSDSKLKRSFLNEKIYEKKIKNKVYQSLQRDQYQRIISAQLFHIRFDKYEIDRFSFQACRTFTEKQYYHDARAVINQITKTINCSLVSNRYLNIQKMYILYRIEEKYTEIPLLFERQIENFQIYIESCLKKSDQKQKKLNIINIKSCYDNKQQQLFSSQKISKNKSSETVKSICNRENPNPNFFSSSPNETPSTIRSNNYEFIINAEWIIGLIHLSQVNFKIPTQSPHTNQIQIYVPIHPFEKLYPQTAQEMNQYINRYVRRHYNLMMITLVKRLIIALKTYLEEILMRCIVALGSGAKVDDVMSNKTQNQLQTYYQDKLQAQNFCHETFFYLIEKTLKLQIKILHPIKQKTDPKSYVSQSRQMQKEQVIPIYPDLNNIPKQHQNLLLLLESQINEQVFHQILPLMMDQIQKIIEIQSKYQHKLLNVNQNRKRQFNKAEMNINLQFSYYSLKSLQIRFTYNQLYENEKWLQLLQFLCIQHNIVQNILKRDYAISSFTQQIDRIISIFILSHYQAKLQMNSNMIQINNKQIKKIEQIKPIYKFYCQQLLQLIKNHFNNQVNTQLYTHYIFALLVLYSKKQIKDINDSNLTFLIKLSQFLQLFPSDWHVKFILKGFEQFRTMSSFSRIQNLFNILLRGSKKILNDKSHAPQVHRNLHLKNPFWWMIVLFFMSLIQDIQLKDMKIILMNTAKTIHSLKFYARKATFKLFIENILKYQSKLQQNKHKIDFIRYTKDPIEKQVVKKLLEKLQVYHRNIENISENSHYQYIMQKKKKQFQKRINKSVQVGP